MKVQRKRVSSGVLGPSASCSRSNAYSLHPLHLPQKQYECVTTLAVLQLLMGLYPKFQNPTKCCYTHLPALSISCSFAAVLQNLLMWSLLQLQSAYPIRERRHKRVCVRTTQDVCIRMTDSVWWDEGRRRHVNVIGMRFRGCQVRKVFMKKACRLGACLHVWKRAATGQQYTVQARGRCSQ